MLQVYLITLFMGDVKQSTTHFFFDIPVGSRRFSRYYYFKELDTGRLRLKFELLGFGSSQLSQKYE